MISIYHQIKNYKGQRAWKYIIIHHSFTNDGQVVDWTAIKNWHTGRNIKSPYCWHDIGYHVGLEFVKGVLTYQVGRSLDHDGAHCRGRNHDAIGICLIGNYDIVEPTHHQYFYLASLCRRYMEKFYIPVHRILGHRSYSEKSCPGEKFNIVKLRNYIKGNIFKYSPEPKKFAGTNLFVT